MTIDAYIANQARSVHDIVQHYTANPHLITETMCGPGSTMANTENVRAWLPKIFAEYHIETVLDAPCGDLYWASQTDFSAVTYTGYDINIADEIHQDVWPQHLEGHNLLTMAAEDIILVDLILCRDFLIHLPNEAIEYVLSNFIASGAHYLATTRIPEATNDDPCPLDGGQHWQGYFDRAINLEKPPFNLPAAIAYIDDPIPGSIWAHKQLALYDLNDSIPASRVTQ